MGIKIVFLHACFFICAVVIFQIYIKKTVSRLSRSYLLLFAIKSILNGESICRHVRAKYAPLSLFRQLFQLSLAVLKIWFVHLNLIPCFDY